MRYWLPGGSYRLAFSLGRVQRNGGPPAVNTPIGPSLSLALVASDAVGCVVASAVKAVWDRYLCTGRFARKLERLERRGLIEPAGEPDLERILRLTREGRALACGGREPVVQWNRLWDERWRLGVFDVPEREAARRNALRDTLAQLGFGYLQDSAWISPDRVETLRRRIAGLKIDVGALTFFDARPCGGESDADLVQGAWNFARINQRYEQYLEVLRNRPRWYEQDAWSRWLQVEWKAWVRAVRSDPLLPSRLLPPGYPGKAAWAERIEVLRSIITR